MSEIEAEPTTAEKLRALPWDIGFSAANSVFVQITVLGSVFVLFLSELGLSKTEIGTLLSLLPFSSLIALFVAPAVARFGYKRTFLVSWSIRSVLTAFLLLTPLVLAEFGTQALVLYITVVVAAFGILRSLGMTARMPWVQEFVPDSVRGKFAAVSNMFAQLAAFLALLVAGVIVERSVGLSGFMVLFGAGVVFGAVSMWAASHVPGGAPTVHAPTDSRSRLDVRRVARDTNFLFFLTGIGCVILATGPLISFLPLYLEEEVGFNSGQVIWLQNGLLLGGLISAYLWGWLADRYGSKPVMMSGISLLVILPVIWLLIPRHNPASFAAAFSVAVLQGLANIGWQIGSMRLRFVSVIPAERKMDYQALYFASIGIVGGAGQLLAGRLLDFSAQLSSEIRILASNSYALLFLGSTLVSLAAGVLLRYVRADSQVSTGDFAAMFLRGNPFTAMESLIRYHRAKDERATVTMTERLGRTQSPLTVDELLEALSDPRFYVRFEAIVSIARRGPDDRLMEALIEVLDGDEPALGTISAWALGRIGDDRALDPLRTGLDARYRSVQAHCVRSLGSLGDTQIIPMVLGRLGSETDVGLQVAYASALGKLGAEQATQTILDLLRGLKDGGSRSELALALARLVGDEHHFIQLLKRAREDFGTAASQSLNAAKKTMLDDAMNKGDLQTILDQCEEAFAREELEQGAALLGRVIRCLPEEAFKQVHYTVLHDCAERLDEFGMSRREYTLLALHTFERGLLLPPASEFAKVSG